MSENSNQTGLKTAVNPPRPVLEAGPEPAPALAFNAIIVWICEKVKENTKNFKGGRAVFPKMQTEAERTGFFAEILKKEANKTAGGGY